MKTNLLHDKTPCFEIHTDGSASEHELGALARECGYSGLTAGLNDLNAWAMPVCAVAEILNNQVPSAGLTRQKAAAIAKDLVEGGINAKGTTKIVAEAHGVSIDAVRKIRRTVLRMGSEMICSMVEAIENGWEDANININP